MEKEVKAKRTATRTWKGVEKEGDMWTLGIAKEWCSAVRQVVLWNMNAEKKAPRQAFKAAWASNVTVGGWQGFQLLRSHHPGRAGFMPLAHG